MYLKKDCVYSFYKYSLTNFYYIKDIYPAFCKFSIYFLQLAAKSSKPAICRHSVVRCSVCRSVETTQACSEHQHLPQICGKLLRKDSESLTIRHANSSPLARQVSIFVIVLKEWIWVWESVFKTVTCVKPQSMNFYRLSSNMETDEHL